MSEAVDVLAEMYDLRVENARERAAGGTPVVGFVGADVPPSLITASGAAPLRLFGHSGQLTDTAEAAELIGRAVDAATMSVLRAILDGDFDFLSGILISHDCQASVMLFYALRELNRSGRVSVPVHLVDLVHLNREPSLRFNIAQLTRAAGVLSAWTGGSVSGASLRTAMTDSAGVDAALERLQTLRRRDRPVISGVDALHGYGIASALPPAEAETALTSAMDRLPLDGSARPELRLFFTGSSPRGDALYQLIERDGVVIVGEDHNWGDLVLTVRPVIPEQGADLEVLCASLASALLSAAPAAQTSGQRARGRATREAIAASHASALLSVVREQDAAAAWDFPHQSAGAGVASAMLDRQPAELDAASEEKLRDALSVLRAAA